MHSSWYIAITNPNCQRRAEGELAALGYGAFWPKMRKWVSHARTKVAKEYPILGRYIFVDIPDGDFWTVRNVNGIEALLTDEQSGPAVVSPEVIYEFRRRYMLGEWDYVASETGAFTNSEGQPEVRHNRVPQGALVRIMEGEFADMITVIRGHTNGKLKILPPGKRNFAHVSEDNVRAA